MIYLARDMQPKNMRDEIILDNGHVSKSARDKRSRSLAIDADINSNWFARKCSFEENKIDKTI